MDEKRGLAGNHVTECDMLQMNGALFNPRAAIRSAIQPGLYCAAPLFRQDSLSLDTAGHTLNGAAHDRPCLPTPSTRERCCSLPLFAARGGGAPTSTPASKARRGCTRTCTNAFPPPNSCYMRVRSAVVGLGAFGASRFQPQHSCGTAGPRGVQRETGGPRWSMEA